MKLTFDSLKNYTPWQGAIETWERIKRENKVKALEQQLEELYPDGIDDGTLNDILWFEEDWVFEMLGISEEEDEENDDEETEDISFEEALKIVQSWKPETKE